jgi:hypothetical protein
MAVSTFLLIRGTEQAAETWLNQFSQQISTDWDFTTVHVNKNDMIGVKADLVHSPLIHSHCI